jgi:hypothetical protein
MLKIDSKKFNFSFFLSDRKKVNSLKEGAIKYGGATMINDEIFSNIEGDEFIKINKNNNKISVFVPSTIDVNQFFDNILYIKEIEEIIKNRYNDNNIIDIKAKGAWYSEEKNDIIEEKNNYCTIRYCKYNRN